MAPPFPRSGPGESGSPMSQVVLRCYDFPSRILGHLFVSLPRPTLPSSIRVSQLALALPEGQRVPSGPGRCSTGDPIAGLLSRGRERDLPGFQAIRPMPLPRSKTPAEPTIPRLLTVSSMLPPLLRQRRLQRSGDVGAIARLQHLLPTLQEWCCHHPCKARFRLAGLPLPGGSQTLWIALKGFRSHFHSPFLDFSWRYRDELPPPHRSCLPTASSIAYRSWGCMSVLEADCLPIFFAAREAGFGPKQKHLKRLSISAYWGNAEILESSIWGVDRGNRHARRD